ncbi:MAG: YeeE/YedE family protein [Chloroflexi bacterium]|nr:YeeE/YedE family protein [Chloroflexota bacterium]
MQSVAHSKLPVAATPPQWLYGLGWAVLLTVALALAALNQIGLAVYGVVGIAFGFTLQRSRFCFASAFRDLFLFRQTRNLKGILLGLAVATVGFTLIFYSQVPSPELGLRPTTAHVIPFGVHSLVGGVLFGIGMVLAGGCISGSCYRMAEGYTGSWVAFGGILAGLWLSGLTWNSWWVAYLRWQPFVWLPFQLGYLGAVGLTLGIIALIYLFLRWWDPSAPNQQGLQLPTTITGWLKRSWSAPVGGLILGVLNIALLAYAQPLGITGEFSRWADGLAKLCGISAGPLIGTDQLTGCALNTGGDWLSQGLMLNGGLFAGSLLSALLAGEFRWRVPPAAMRNRRYGQSLFGGVIMGYGAGIAVGCTIGAFFSAIPSLGLNGWVFAVGLFVGAGVGVWLIQKMGL